jgi:hypothetical protein
MSIHSDVSPVSRLSCLGVSHICAGTENAKRKEASAMGTPIPPLQHTSEVPRVLNLSTGSITTQYRVVFDDLFTTVSSVDRDHAPPDHWEDLCLENSTQITVDNPPDYITDEWLTRGELDEK